MTKQTKVVVTSIITGCGFGAIWGLSTYLCQSAAPVARLLPIGRVAGHILMWFGSAIVVSTTLRLLHPNRFTVRNTGLIVAAWFAGGLIFWELTPSYVRPTPSMQGPLCASTVDLAYAQLYIAYIQPVFLINGCLLSLLSYVFLPDISWKRAVAIALGWSAVWGLNIPLADLNFDNRILHASVIGFISGFVGISVTLRTLDTGHEAGNIVARTHLPGVSRPNPIFLRKTNANGFTPALLVLGLALLLCSSAVIWWLSREHPPIRVPLQTLRWQPAWAIGGCMAATSIGAAVFAIERLRKHKLNGILQLVQLSGMPMQDMVAGYFRGALSEYRAGGAIALGLAPLCTGMVFRYRWALIFLDPDAVFAAIIMVMSAATLVNCLLFGLALGARTGLRLTPLASYTIACVSSIVLAGALALLLTGSVPRVAILPVRALSFTAAGIVTMMTPFYATLAVLKAE